MVECLRLEEYYRCMDELAHRIILIEIAVKYDKKFNK